jgi:hypothetical protein
MGCAARGHVFERLSRVAKNLASVMGSLYDKAFGGVAVNFTTQLRDCGF